jgi:hypothetical protein
MDVSEAQEAKQLRDENTRLEKLVVGLSLDKEMLKAVIAKNGWRLVNQRADADWLRGEYAASERRVCGLMGMAVSSYRHQTTWCDEELRKRLVELAREKPRLGYRRLHVLLFRAGEAVNHKRVHRVYRAAGLSLRRKKRKHCVRVGQPLLARTAANQEWALDFVHDAAECGRAVRVLSVVDAYTRECLALEVDTSFASRRATRVLEAIMAERGQPGSIRCDNGPEFTSRHFLSSFAVSSSLRDWVLRVTMAVGVTAAILLAPGKTFAQAQTPALGNHSQILRTVPLTNFYDTAHPLPAGKPAQLIRSEASEEYALPPEVSAVRILYHSRSAAGEDVAASGVVLFPREGNPPAGGWPVIAWAHGATGVARPCAPSLIRNVGYGPFLSMYVNLGYAVVATDYTGLGTNFRNAFLDGPSNAADLIASISAARAAVPQLGTRWIVMGEAEGSLAAVAVAEKENEIRDPGYLGGIAISGLASTKDIYEHSTRGSSSLMLTSLAYGIKTVYPQFQVTDMLTEKGLALYQDVEQMCSLARTSPELSPAEVVKPSWENNAFVRQYFVRNSLGERRAYGPILVVSGDADQAIPVTMTAQAIARMCKQGDWVRWERYPDLEPGRVIGDSVRDQIAWIEARFAGRTTPTNCP